MSDIGFTSPSAQPVTVAPGVVTTSVNFTLPATSSMSGAVLDSQSPAQRVAGATVTYTGTNGNTAGGTMLTNSSGGYAFNVVSPGTYSVNVSDSGFTSPAAQPVTVALASRRQPTSP